MYDLVKGETIPYGKHKFYTFDRYEGDAVILKDPNSKTLYRVSKTQFEKNVKTENYIKICGGKRRGGSKIFLVNQPETFKQDKTKTTIWTPKNAKMRERKTYQLGEEISAGDFVVHAVKGKIVAISIVVKSAYEADCTYEDALTAKYGIKGVQVNVSREDLDEPISLSELAASNNAGKDSCFDKNGHLKQGTYWAKLNDQLAHHPIIEQLVRKASGKQA